MKIGAPKEIKNHEYRVGLVPPGVKELCEAGHEVFVEASCGSEIGYSDEDYKKAGATVVKDAAALYGSVDLVVKIKEPQESEIPLIKSNHTIFAYLHLAPNKPLLKDLMASGASCIAYETVTADGHVLPLLAPMSEVAGKLATQVGSHYLEKAQGGDGVLLGGVTNVEPGKVVVLGAGVVGRSAAKIAVGMGANVCLVDFFAEALKNAEKEFGSTVSYVDSSQQKIDAIVQEADLVVGGVLVAGGKAPVLVSKDMISSMKNGSVIVDVAIDQGGCFETSRPTSHADPVYVVEGVTHYCVTNMPSAAAYTATRAITHATLPFTKQLAGFGVEEALKRNPHLANGLNVYKGEVTHEELAHSVGMPFKKVF